jgi:hypothetical protein
MNDYNAIVVVRNGKKGCINTKTGTLTIPALYEAIFFESDPYTSKKYIIGKSGTQEQRYDMRGKIVPVKKATVGKEPTGLTPSRDSMKKFEVSESTTTIYTSMEQVSMSKNQLRIDFIEEAGGVKKIVNQITIRADDMDSICFLGSFRDQDPDHPIASYKATDIEKINPFLLGYKNGKIGIINHEGTLVSNGFYDAIFYRSHKDKNLIYIKDGQYGIMCFSGWRCGKKFTEKPLKYFFKEIAMTDYSDVYRVVLRDNSICYYESDNEKIILPFQLLTEQSRRFILQ